MAWKSASDSAPSCSSVPKMIFGAMSLLQSSDNVDPTQGLDFDSGWEYILVWVDPVSSIADAVLWELLSHLDIT